MPQRQKTCKQQRRHQQFHQFHTRIWRNLSPNSWYKSHKCNQQRRNWNHSIREILGLEIYPQVQYRQQPQWKEYNCYRVKGILKHWYLYTCIFVWWIWLLLLKFTHCHFLISSQVSFLLLIHFQAKLSFLTIFSHLIIVLILLPIRCSQPNILIVGKHFFQILKYLLILFLLFTFLFSPIPVWLNSLTFFIVPLKILIQQYLIIVVSNI